MERGMRMTSLGEADVARVVIIGGVTSAVMLALLVAKPFHSATAIIAPSLADISQPSVARPATEAASFVPSPVMKPLPVFFVGNGDGSNGYFGEQQKPAATHD